ncbi:MAG: GGDEF domain-containing protein [Armatimonadota bacterium]
MQTMTSIMLVPDAAPPEELLAICSQLGLRVRTVSTPDAMQHVISAEDPCVVLLVCTSDDAAAWRLVDLVRAQVPEAPVLWHCVQGAASTAQVETRGLLAATTPQDSPQMLAQWVRAALALSGERHNNARLRANLTDLRTLTAELPTWEEDFEELLSEVLTTAVRICRRESAGSGQLSGALLSLGGEKQLIARVADGQFAPYLSARLPEPFTARALQVAQSKEAAIIEGTLYLPLHWQHHIRGILIVDGIDPAGQVSDLMAFLSSYLSTILENDVLYELAAVDSTTRMFTRSFTLQRLHESLKATYRNRQNISVLMLDLDHFKQINDTHGHLVGDRVLQEIGSLLRGTLRETDILGRYGGDEFLVVLPNTPVEGGLLVGQRIRDAVNALRLDVDGQPLQLGISIGITGIQPGEVTDEFRGVRLNPEFFKKVIQLLIGQADGLMYRAKQQKTTSVACGRALSWSGLLRLHRQDDEMKAGVTP